MDWINTGETTWADNSAANPNIPAVDASLLDKLTNYGKIFSQGANKFATDPASLALAGKVGFGLSKIGQGTQFDRAGNPVNLPPNLGMMLGDLAYQQSQQNAGAKGILPLAAPVTPKPVVPAAPVPATPLSTPNANLNAVPVDQPSNFSQPGTVVAPQSAVTPEVLPQPMINTSVPNSGPQVPVPATYDMPNVVTSDKLVSRLAEGPKTAEDVLGRFNLNERDLSAMPLADQHALITSALNVVAHQTARQKEENDSYKNMIEAAQTPGKIAHTFSQANKDIADTAKTLHPYQWALAEHTGQEAGKLIADNANWKARSDAQMETTVTNPYLQSMYPGKSVGQIMHEIGPEYDKMIGHWATIAAAELRAGAVGKGEELKALAELSDIYRQRVQQNNNEINKILIKFPEVMKPGMTQTDAIKATLTLPSGSGLMTDPMKERLAILNSDNDAAQKGLDMVTTGLAQKIGTTPPETSAGTKKRDAVKAQTPPAAATPAAKKPMKGVAPEDQKALESVYNTKAADIKYSDGPMPIMRYIVETADKRFIWMGGGKYFKMDPKDEQDIREKLKR